MNRPITILLVEDDAIVRQSIALLLQRAGHEVMTAKDGRSALAFLSEHPLDLVITDFSMPGMHGDELATNIRKRWPNQRIIMATAFAAEYEVFAQGAGNADALLIKPFSFPELTEAIEQVMAGKASLVPSEAQPGFIDVQHCEQQG